MSLRRFILLLDPQYPLEKEMMLTLESAPKREKATFLRALVLIGFGEVKKDKARKKLASAGTEKG